MEEKARVCVGIGWREVLGQEIARVCVREE